MPYVVAGWEVSDGGKTAHLQAAARGMKWSDGAPFTADDIMFWYEDLYGNKELTPTPTAEMSINGKPGDDREGRRSDRPLRLPRAVLRLPRRPGRGRLRRSAGRPTRAMHAARPVRPEALPHEVPPEVHAAGRRSTQKVKAAGFDNWVNLFKLRTDWRAQPRSAGRDCLEDDHARSTPRPGRWSGTRTTTGWTPRGTSSRTSTRSR